MHEKTVNPLERDVLVFTLSFVFRCRGFLKLKIQGTYGTPVAFVDFQVQHSQYRFP